PAQAAELQRRVVALGRRAILFPLLEIQPLADQEALRQALHTLDTYALIAFVSPNAIDAAFAARPDWPRQVPLAVVGEGSRQALQRHGVRPESTRIFCPVDPDHSDSEGLLQALDLAALRGKPVLIVRGETGRELLADALRNAGAQVSTLAAYRRVPPAFDEQRRRELAGLLRSQNDWLVTSSEALRILLDMVVRLNEAEGVAKMQQQRIIVPHMRIAETARTLGFVNIVQSRSGDDGLIAALQSCS
ncbi:MAG TPA: uroporphyrinogen-III synthase, partial [Oxalicibacterium sp.]|nr:uroporphyrinogen-III synthase [Oxalicibacterium sp.]